jgi:hypothetical protein
MSLAVRLLSTMPSSRRMQIVWLCPRIRSKLLVIVTVKKDHEIAETDKRNRKTEILQGLSRNVAMSADSIVTAKGAKVRH